VGAVHRPCHIEPYRIVPQIKRQQRSAPSDLQNCHTRTRSGDLIPLSTLVSLDKGVVPRSLNGFQQLNAVTLSGIPRPGIALGEALATLESIAADALTREYSVDYAGQSRQFKTEGSSLVATFFFALLLIYLVLAAEFESFRDPVIMLVTVPMSVSGALLRLNVLAMFQVNGATLFSSSIGSPSSRYSSACCTSAHQKATLRGGTHGPN